MSAIGDGFLAEYTEGSLVLSFSGAVFLFLFLPVALLGYYVLPPKFRNRWLLFTSLLFYTLGDVRHLPLLLLVAVLQYTAAIFLEKYPKYRRFWLILAIVVNLWLLFYYKYASFFLSVFGVSVASPALPIGISFYTFQAISYTVDVYRGEVRAERKFTVFLTYLTLFPQLVAGPIVRYREVDRALTGRRFTLSQCSRGAFLFSVGLFKKLALADSLATLSGAFSEGSPTALLAWLSAIAFTLQIYFDFSGYSDMARGLGRLFGFEFPENFRYPYIASSIGEFWRRWHITLSSFFKSYVYIPLGGNRRGKARTALNLLVVWLLTGLWHGAAYTFLVWGLLYGLLLVFEKLTNFRLPVGLGNLYTLFFVVVGFVFFAADSLSSAFSQLAAMLAPSVWADGAAARLLSDHALLLAVSAVFATPLPAYLMRKLMKTPERLALSRAALTPILLVLSFSFLVGASAHPFLYFRF